MISPYVIGADGRRTAPTALPTVPLQLPIMNTEHDARGPNGTDRLAAVDGGAASTRQAVG
ncbi:hypothetical protein GCM10022232_35190 [Streptomyces plumbiresistens]|uniref:Uncharacterized protein n=1 Tax=Streptomyces plumbiresistens TaxID=511811 RepID=A0ABP7RCG4_9ACTN